MDSVPVKKGVRILGIDDSPFTKTSKRRVLVTGVVYREGIVEGIISTRVGKDGRDATDKLHRMLNGSRFREQVKLVLLNGIMLGGFNVVDINKLSESFGLPVIAVTRRKPDMRKVFFAVSRLRDAKERISIIKAAGESMRVTLGGNAFFFQSAGISKDAAKRSLSRYGVESVRLAHLIGSGVVKGESSGRL